MHVEKLLLDLPGLETNAPIKVSGEKPIMQTQLPPEKDLFIYKNIHIFISGNESENLVTLSSTARK
jgi:hypothetical protein